MNMKLLCKWKKRGIEELCMYPYTEEKTWQHYTQGKVRGVDYLKQNTLSSVLPGNISASAHAARTS